MTEATQHSTPTSSTPYTELCRKLDPRRHHWSNPTFSGIVGFVLGVSYGIPVIDQVVVVYDGTIVARPQGSSQSCPVGTYNDLVSRWTLLLGSARLNLLEWMAAEALFATKIGFLFDVSN